LFYRGPSGLMVLSFDEEPTFEPGTPTQLFEWSFISGATRRLAVSPDGERFLTISTANVGDDDEDPQKPQIILVENWFEELEAKVPAK